MTRHEPCPACGDQMRLRSWPAVAKEDKQCYLECQGCDLLYGFNVYSGGGTYQSPESLWYAWDTGISEQRGKWLEEHPCDGCEVEEANHFRVDGDGITIIGIPPSVHIDTKQVVTIHGREFPDVESLDWLADAVKEKLEREKETQG